MITRPLASIRPHVSAVRPAPHSVFGRGLALALWLVVLGSALFSASCAECVPSDEGGCLPTAPRRDRVDLYSPTFSSPTAVTNPLFPISDQHSMLQLGIVDGLPFRAEVTLLPELTLITLSDGRVIETLTSQYAAYLDGRLHEVALDWYAQDDLGAVWYLGEDVFNYEAGVVAEMNGTWRAGRDGVEAMIMPGNPAVGDVYRPENMPGFVFEEVTVREIGATVDGPTGPVPGAIVVEELHQDGTTEGKTFAPGYGEFITGNGIDVETTAINIPTDALSGPSPAELVALRTGAEDVFDAADAGDWTAASAAVADMTAAWDAFRAGGLPAVLEAQMEEAMAALAAAVGQSDAAPARQASIAVARAALDFELRHRPFTEIDAGRFELWAWQVLVDVTAGDADSVRGDTATLEWIRDRFAYTLDTAARASLDATLIDLRAAADASDLAAAAGIAEDLRVTIAGL